MTTDPTPESQLAALVDKNPTPTEATNAIEQSTGFKDIPSKEEVILAPMIEPTIAPNEKAINDLDKQLIERLGLTIEDPLADAKPITKVLLYGAMGSGKTKAACEAPKPLLIAIERGQSTIYNHPAILASGIKVMKFKSVQQVVDLADMIQKGYLKEIGDYETIILDTFSELQYTALDGRVITKWQEAPHSRDQFTPEGKDYQANTQHMRRIAAAYRNIDINVIFTCHSRDDEVGLAKAVVRSPSTTPQVTHALNQYVDVVAYMYNETDQEGEEHYYALTRTTQTREARILAKTRIGSLLTVEENLTFNRVHEAKLNQIQEARKLTNHD